MENVTALETGELGFDLSLLCVFALLMLLWDFVSWSGWGRACRAPETLRSGSIGSMGRAAGREAGQVVEDPGPDPVCGPWGAMECSSRMAA